MDGNEEIKAIFEGMNRKEKINIINDFSEKLFYKKNISISKTTSFKNQIIIRKNKRYLLEISKDNLINKSKVMKIRYKFKNSNDNSEVLKEISENSNDDSEDKEISENSNDDSKEFTEISENSNDDPKEFKEISENSNDDSEEFKEISEDKKLRLFGNTFIKNNKNKSKILMNGHLKELKNFINTEDIIKIKLLSLENIDDLSEMFYDCKYLTKIDYIEKLKIKNITNMERIYYNCQSLKEIPNYISNWNTNNVKDMSEIFSGCKS